MSESNPFPLPVQVEGITANWITTALRTRTPGVTIRACEVVDTVFSTCSKIRLRLDRDEAAVAAGIPELVIVKGGFEEHGRRYHQMHEREVRGYRDVYPHVPLPHPACFFAEYDEQEKQGIIIMEDLVAKGVEFCHATRPQTHEQVARRLGYLARFHAATWASPELEPGGRWADLPGFFPVMQHFFDEKSSPENWARFMAAPRGVATSRYFQNRDWLVDSWERMMAYAAGLPHCVLHGDIHLGNLYIEQDGTPGFLDTLASRGPGMLEVAYHISGSLDVADRPKWEGALVRHYLDELERAGAPAPDFDEAMKQYAVFLLYGYFIWITTESHYQAEAVNTVNAMRSTMAMLDHDTAGRIGQISVQVQL
ncbi:ecdysteroid 22-kinase family protein [Novosphingobium album (ex Hu et al. 2023)]|uniref:Ecdysteroid 22-kinase family protein n=1 Tax=Novosphingobium album (ex Hu et al. 2023) TaxID=2930093 RepID=A0ABT0AZ09_9SPHN|nr:ecdysteroid 22-kinase family protein [Novosphingobium album (ex Hu et al. 2023)]MCJ2177779.1 ecdysteroid 22-kinase family protein [Novosphingobium album (ex Hu et al. 2023)]